MAANLYGISKFGVLDKDKVQGKEIFISNITSDEKGGDPLSDSEFENSSQGAEILASRPVLINLGELENFVV